MTEASLELSAGTRRLLLQRGLRLEYATLGWNVLGSVLVLDAAAAARSVALAGFGLDSLIEIVASAVVVWQLKDTDKHREHKALRLIGIAFILLALYIGAQSTYVLAAGFRPHHSQLGIAWLALTALAMFTLARCRHRWNRAAATCKSIRVASLELSCLRQRSASKAALMEPTCLGTTADQNVIDAERARARRLLR